MELIAASRIVKAQARVHAAQPYADGITEVVRNLQAAGAGVEQPVARAAAERRARSASVVLAADRGLCGGYNSTRHPRRRARHPRAARRRAARPRSSPSAARPRATSASATTRSTPRSPGSATARPTRTRGGSRRPSSRRFEAGELDLVQLVYTRFISAGRQEVVRRAAAAARAGAELRSGRRRRRERDEPERRLRVRAGARGDPRHAAAALRRGARLRRAARTRPRRSTRPASGR